MTDTVLPLKGIIPPLVTPLLGRDEIDVDGTRRLIDHVIGGGVHGLFLLGTSGEAPSLSHKTQQEFIQIACEQIQGRVPVLVGITDTSMTESIEFAKFSQSCGADAVVLATPYYFPMHQQDLKRYVEEMAAELPLPFLLYNMPSHTKVSYEIGTIESLMKIEKFIGVKDSSANMLYYNKLIDLKSERENFTVLVGPEELMAQSVLMGGDGGISGGANLVPSLFVSLYEAAVTEDLREVHRLQHQVLRLSKSLYEVGAAPTGYLAGIKTALGFTGLCSDRLCEPLYEMPEDRKQLIHQHMSDLGLFESMGTEGIASQGIGKKSNS